jgi:hypothetical protein
VEGFALVSERSGRSVVMSAKSETDWNRVPDWWLALAQGMAN